MDLPEPDDRLNSWKEIAAFLGRTVRTVQRWEKTHGLPLRRGGPGQRGAVVASKREIGDWWERRRSTLQDERVPSGTTADSDAEPVERQILPPSAPPVGWRPVIYAGLIGLVLATATADPFRRPVAATAESPRKLGRLLATSTSEGRTSAYIPLNASPSGLVLSPSGDLAYVSLDAERAVAVVDLRARRVVDRFDVIDRPAKLILSADGTRLLVRGSSELGVVDLRDRTLTRFAVGGGSVHDVHLSRDDRYVWTSLAQAGLKVLDLETGRWETIPTVGCPTHLAAAPRTRRLFLAYQCGGPGGRDGHDAIEIIDEMLRRSILARAGPPLVGSALAVSPDEQHVWIDTGDACTNPEYDQAGCPPGTGPVLHALRADTLDALLTIRVPADRPQTSPLFLPDGTRLVLAGNGLNVIDRGLGTVLESTPLEHYGGAFSSDGGRFVALRPVDGALVEFELSPPADMWTFREAVTHWSGDGTANDIIGGTHALAMEGLRFEPGRYGQAFSFDAAAVGVSFGRRLNADIAQSATTYTAWIKPRRTGVPLHIASRTSRLGWQWSMTSDGRLAFCLAHGQQSLACEHGGLVGSTILQPDRWYHVAVVRSDSVLALFVDAKKDGSRSSRNEFLDAGFAWKAAVLRLGAGPEGSAPFDGLIDEVVLFSRALSVDDLMKVRRATSLEPR